MAVLGITGGCGGGNYCPGAPVTREQMAAFIIRALGEFSPPFPAGQRFLDVPFWNPFYAFIERMAVLGITGGCGGGNYCPTSPVTREQMAAFIIRALGEFDPPLPPTQRFADVPPTSPFYRFIERMAVLGITSGCGGGNYCPADPVTREQMSVFLSTAFGLTLYGP
jgi:S-layer homology domain